MRGYVKNKKELAENMKFIRKCFDVPQHKVTDMLEIERSTYVYYECGKNEINPYKSAELAEIFDVNLMVLVTGDELLKARMVMNHSPPQINKSKKKRNDKYIAKNLKKYDERE